MIPLSTLHTGKLIKYARSINNISLEQLALSSKIGLSRLLLFENESEVPNISEWVSISNSLGIDFESYKYGVIDLESVVDIRSGINENGFILPVRYSKNKCIKVREILPIIFFSNDQYGPETAETVISEMNIDPIFFNFLDNQINLAFFNDFLLELNSLDSSIGIKINAIGQYFSKNFVHGKIAKKYKLCRSQKDLICNYIQQINKYEKIFYYSLLESNQSIYLSVGINPIISSDLENTETITQSFLETYREEKIKSLASNFLEENFLDGLKLKELNEIKSIYWNDPKTVYEIKFSA